MEKIIRKEPTEPIFVIVINNTAPIKQINDGTGQKYANIPAETETALPPLNL